jgi:thymidylate synthase (FAD)
MRIVQQEHKILCPSEWGLELKLIEAAGRTAYKSEDRIEADSYRSFISGIVKRGHLAVIEFGNMVVQFVTDRGISHELVRHRICSFVQESSRYCNYGSGKFGSAVTVVRPSGLQEGSEELAWTVACQDAEQKYLYLTSHGVSAQSARSVLPTCTKTEIVVKANFREWRHIFRIRAVEKAAHPDMRALMIPLYEECRAACPEIFDLGDPE